MPAIKYVHVFYDSAAEAPYRRIRDVLWGLSDLGWKCQRVCIGDGKATAWLVNPDSLPQVRGDRPLQQ